VIYVVKIVDNSDRYIERICPNCQRQILPIYFKTTILDVGTNFKDHIEIPNEFKNPSYHPSVYLFGCPKCKNIFFEFVR